MADEKYTGSCLCKAVNYEFSGPAKTFQYCHCTRCQKVTGSAHASNIIVDPSGFRWTRGEELVGRYELPEAKYFAVSFCRQCGSNLPWLNQRGTSVIIPAGTLDVDPGVRPKWNIFVANHAPWYEDPNALPRFDELPPRR